MFYDYQMDNGMYVDIDYDVDPHDSKCLEINTVEWRGLNIMHLLMPFEINELYAACYEDDADRARCAAEDRYDSMRDGS